MLEVLGYGHHTSPGRARCWSPGVRADGRRWNPKEGCGGFCKARTPHRVVQQLCSLEYVLRLLRYFGTTKLATDRVMADVCWKGAREQMLGALKMLEVVGIATHGKLSKQAVGWAWADTDECKPYKPGRLVFGCGHTGSDSLDEPQYDSEGNYLGTRIDNLSEEDLLPDSSD
jgi:hypothetical protein